MQYRTDAAKRASERLLNLAVLPRHAFFEVILLWMNIKTDRTGKEMARNGQYAVKKGEKKIRVVGKMTDITEEKKKEEDFLVNAKKDAATGFLTWDIGEQLIERLEGEKQQKLYYLFFKVLFLNKINNNIDRNK